MDSNNRGPFYRNGPPFSDFYPPDYYRTPFRAPSTSQTVNLPIIAIATLGIIATAVLFIGYYIFAIKFCLNSHRFDFLRRMSSNRGPRHRGDPLIVYAAPIQNNRGLDESVIRSIPVFRFKKGVEDGKEKYWDECAVCLKEFQENERLRLLPSCSHAFHIDCIDTWLQSNANCPLCRSSIPNIRPCDRNKAGNPYRSPHQFSDHPGIEVSDDGNERSASSQVISNVMSTQSSDSEHNPSPSWVERRIPSEKHRLYQHLSSMGDECIELTRKDERFSVQPLRRSFSMDSSGDRQLYLSVQEILRQKPRIQEVSSSSEAGSRSRRFFFPFGHGQ